jgi:hypothetical protein
MMLTRLGLYGGARAVYGSFAGKVPAPPVGSNWSSNYNFQHDILN